MKLIKSAAIAFSMYSRIPMPQVRWDEAYMKHVLCFLPLVGIIVGGLEVGWYCAAQVLGVTGWLFAAIAAIIPVVVTGGIHLDGLMDTNDALASFGEPEKRHAILKDPHSGAFAVIHCCLYFLTTAGCYAHVYETGDWKDIAVVAAGYVVSRAVCALCVVGLPCAKDSGLAYIFKSGAGKRTVAAVQILCLLAAAGILFWLSPVALAFFAVLVVAAVIHFRVTILKKFAGITGDLAGFILTRVELLAGLAAVGVLLLKGVLAV